MAISVVMPALEMAQENGKLLAWRKKEGERVQKGEPLLEIETDKAVVEVESPGDGLLAGVTAQIGAVIPVGETIAWLGAPGGEAAPDDGVGGSRSARFEQQRANLSSCFARPRGRSGITGAANFAERPPARQGNRHRHRPHTRRRRRRGDPHI